MPAAKPGCRAANLDDPVGDQNGREPDRAAQASWPEPGHGANAKGNRPPRARSCRRECAALRRASGVQTAARQRIAASASDERGDDQGVDEPDLRDKELGQMMGVNSLGPARPSCLAKLAQPCAAFQTTNGAKIAIATARPARAQARQASGAARASRPGRVTTPAAKKAAVNFDCNAKPESQAHCDEPAPFAGAPELDQGAEPKRPKDDQRRIGTDEHRSDGDERHGDPNQRRQRSLFGRIEEAPGYQGDKRGHRANGEEARATTATAPTRRGIEATMGPVRRYPKKEREPERADRLGRRSAGAAGGQRLHAQGTIDAPRRKDRPRGAA